MITAEKIVCELIDRQHLLGECVLPDPGALEWASALSGVVSTMLAIGFGVWSILQSRSDRERVHEAERRVRLGQVSDRIVDAFSKISETEYVQYQDLPWVTTHMQSLRQALIPFGEVADEFYDEVSKFAVEISSYVSLLFIHESESEWSFPKQIELGIVPGLRLRGAVGTMRSGLNAFAYAEDDDARRQALENFVAAKKHTSLNQ